MKKLKVALADETKSQALVALAFDFVVAQPVGRFVDAERVLQHLERALAEHMSEAAIRDQLRPALDRELERARKRDDRLADWLTAEAIAELRSLAARPVRLKRAFLEGLVKQEAVSHLVRSVVEETLDRFLQTLKPGGSGGGVLGAVGRGAVGFASGLGKGFLGGLGAQMESQLKAAASAFIASSMNVVMDRVVTILAAPETGAKLGRMNAQGFDAALKLKTHVVLGKAHDLPLDDLLGVIPGLIVHNLERAEVRAGLLDEVRILLEREGQRTLASVLEEARGLAAWRDEVLEVAGPLLREFTASEPFRDWLEKR